MPCSRQKINDCGKIRLITGKPVYWATSIGRFVLFWFVFSSPPNHAEFRTWKIKTPSSHVKLFKPPIVRETLSRIQKTLSYQRELVSLLSQIKISLHLAIYLTNSRLWLRAAEICEETHVFPKLNQLTNHSRLILDMQIIMPRAIIWELQCKYMSRNTMAFCAIHINKTRRVEESWYNFRKFFQSPRVYIRPCKHGKSALLLFRKQS